MMARNVGSNKEYGYARLPKLRWHAQIAIAI
jgi:hypothetical protein